MADEQIAKQLANIQGQLDKVFDRLWGGNGYEGDMPEIKQALKDCKAAIEAQERRIGKMETKVSLMWKAVTGAAAAAGGALGAAIKGLIG